MYSVWRDESSSGISSLLMRKTIDKEGKILSYVVYRVRNLHVHACRVVGNVPYGLSARTSISSEIEFIGDGVKWHALNLRYKNPIDLSLLSVPISTDNTAIMEYVSRL